jgi:putative transposase
LRILRQVEVELAAGADVATSCRSAGISDATFYTWRKKFGSGHKKFARPRMSAN